MRLLILAGGLGTRLKTAVSCVPKALAPVDERPLLQLQIEHWIAQGISQFTFLLHHQCDQIIDYIKIMQRSTLKDCRVDWICEPTPLDTGGAIAYAVYNLNLSGNFLVTNADTWLGAGMRKLILSVPPAIAVVRLLNISRYGEVHFGIDNRVTDFVEKNPISSSGWINAGLCHLTSELFKNWNGDPFSLERDLFTRLVQQKKLTAIPLQTDFIDIGVPDDYYRFCQWVKSGGEISLCN